MAEDIVQNIALSGQDEVIQAFGEIAQAGVRAMEQIAQAAAHTDSAFGRSAEAIAGVAAGGAAVIGTTFLWAKQSAEAGHNLEILAEQAGESVEQISALQGALSNMGGNSEHLSQAFRRMGTVITHTWEELKKDVAGSADKMIADSLRIDHAEDALDRARLNRAKAMGQRVDPREEQALKARQAEHALEQAQENAWQAQKKRQEDRLNQPAQYLKAVEDVLRGEKTAADAAKTATLSVDNIVKGLIGNTEGADEAFKNFNGNLRSITGEGPKVQQVFYNLADFLKNSGNAALNSSLMMRLFGRTMGSELLPVFMQGSSAIKENVQRMKDLGMVMDHEGVEKARKFHEAFNNLSHDLEITSQKIGLLFAPAYTKNMQEFSKYLEDNHKQIMKFGEDVADKVTPYIDGFFDVLKGGAAALAGDTSVTGGAEKWKERWELIGRALKGVGDTISGITGDIQKTVNNVFGTDISKLDAGIGSAIAWKALGGKVGTAFKLGFVGAATFGLYELLAGGKKKAKAATPEGEAMEVEEPGEGEGGEGGGFDWKSLGILGATMAIPPALRGLGKGGLALLRGVASWLKRNPKLAAALGAGGAAAVGTGTAGASELPSISVTPEAPSDEFTGRKYKGGEGAGFTREYLDWMKSRQAAPAAGGGAAEVAAGVGAGAALSGAEKIGLMIRWIGMWGISLGTLVGIYKDLNHESDAVEKSMDDLEKRYKSGTISAEQYADVQKLLGERWRSSTGGLEELNKQLEAGTITFDQYVKALEKQAEKFQQARRKQQDAQKGQTEEEKKAAEEKKKRDDAALSDAERARQREESHGLKRVRQFPPAPGTRERYELEQKGFRFPPSGDDTSAFGKFQRGEHLTEDEIRELEKKGIRIGPTYGQKPVPLPRPAPEPKEGARQQTTAPITQPPVTIQKTPEQQLRDEAVERQKAEEAAAAANEAARQRELERTSPTELDPDQAERLQRRFRPRRSDVQDDATQSLKRMSQQTDDTTESLKHLGENTGTVSSAFASAPQVTDTTAFAGLTQVGQTAPQASSGLSQTAGSGNNAATALDRVAAAANHAASELDKIKAPAGGGGPGGESTRAKDQSRAAQEDVTTGMGGKGDKGAEEGIQPIYPPGPGESPFKPGDQRFRPAPGPGQRPGQLPPGWREPPGPGEQPGPRKVPPTPWPPPWPREGHPPRKPDELPGGPRGPKPGDPNAPKYRPKPEPKPPPSEPPPGPSPPPKPPLKPTIKEGPPASPAQRQWNELGGTGVVPPDWEKHFNDTGGKSAYPPTLPPWQRPAVKPTEPPPPPPPPGPKIGPPLDIRPEPQKTERPSPDSPLYPGPRESPIKVPPMPGIGGTPGGGGPTEPPPPPRQPSWQEKLGDPNQPFRPPMIRTPGKQDPPGTNVVPPGTFPEPGGRGPGGSPNYPPLPKGGEWQQYDFGDGKKVWIHTPTNEIRVDDNGRPGALLGPKEDLTRPTPRITVPDPMFGKPWPPPAEKKPPAPPPGPQKPTGAEDKTIEQIIEDAKKNAPPPPTPTPPERPPEAPFKSDEIPGQRGSLDGGAFAAMRKRDGQPDPNYPMSKKDAQEYQRQIDEMVRKAKEDEERSKEWQRNYEEQERKLKEANEAANRRLEEAKLDLQDPERFREVYRGISQTPGLDPEKFVAGIESHAPSGNIEERRGDAPMGTLEFYARKGLDAITSGLDPSALYRHIVGWPDVTPGSLEAQLGSGDILKNGGGGARAGTRAADIDMEAAAEAEQRQREEEEREREREREAQQQQEQIQQSIEAATSSGGDSGGSEERREQYAGGGPVRGPGSGTSDSVPIRASAGEYVVRADGSNLRDAVSFFTRGFAMGGLVTGFTGSVRGYAEGGAVVPHAATNGSNVASYHALDITTDKGSFRAQVTQDTMAALQSSALSSKLSQTGERPSWFS